MVVVVMVAVALIVAMVVPDPFLDFGAIRSGVGVYNNNNNNIEYGQERKGRNASRVIVGSPVTSEAQVMPRHGEATIVTQHERYFPGQP